MFGGLLETLVWLLLTSSKFAYPGTFDAPTYIRTDESGLPFAWLTRVTPVCVFSGSPPVVPLYCSGVETSYNWIFFIFDVAFFAGLTALILRYPHASRRSHPTTLNGSLLGVAVRVSLITAGAILCGLVVPEYVAISLSLDQRFVWTWMVAFGSVLLVILSVRPVRLGTVASISGGEWTRLLAGVGGWFGVAGVLIGVSSVWAQSITYCGNPMGVGVTDPKCKWTTTMAYPNQGILGRFYLTGYWMIVLGLASVAFFAVFVTVLYLTVNRRMRGSVATPVGVV